MAGRLLAWLGVLCLGLLLYGYAAAAQDPRVVRYTVRLPGLEAGRTLRIVQLSDSHGSLIDMPPTRLERVVAAMNALKPDMVVLTGDYIGGKLIDWPGVRLERVTDPFAALRAPLGVYAVAGNHDTVLWTRWAFARARTVKFLSDSWADAGPVIVAGLDDYTNGVQPGPRATKVLAAIPPSKPVIALGHEPDYFPWVPKRVGLFIAGHTHGGQIILPGGHALYLSDYLQAHRRGVFTEQGHTMVVSSGLGTSIVPLRMGVPPEIVEITVVGAG
jgi:predicted MPP superfamily phosphohydrolase